MTFIYSAAAFLLALAILIVVHEMGHFLVARRLGVHVLSFSFGFGYPLFQRKDKQGTTFFLRLIPLGGYVRLLDESEGPVPPALADKAFNRKSLWARTCVVIAGPLANFLLAILFFWILFIKGVPTLTTVVTSVEPHSIAAIAGVQKMDRLVAVNGNPVINVEELYLALLNAMHGQTDIDIKLKRQHNGVFESSHVTLPILSIQGKKDKTRDLFAQLGVQFAQPEIEPIIGQVIADSPAQKAGLQAGDRITRVNDRKVNTWHDLVSYVRVHPDETIQISFRRNDVLMHVPVTLGSVNIREQKHVGQIGIAVQIPYEKNPYIKIEQRNPVTALRMSVTKVASVSYLTIKMILQMFTGQSEWENLNGPLSIAQSAGVSAMLGWVEYFRFLALISISIGVLNLLPIPMLDGGHLLYYALEAIRGKPLAERGMRISTSIGLAFLLLLMSVAFYNDFVNL